MKLIVSCLLLLSIYSCTNQHDKNMQVNRFEKQDTIEVEHLTLEDTPKNMDLTNMENWCSTAILKKVTDSIETLNADLIREFLSTFHCSCEENIEYSEWSNELLFEVTLRKPETIIHFLNKNSEIDYAFILNVYETPVHDEIYINKVIEQVRSTKVYDILDTRTLHGTHQKILKALEKAKQKMVKQP